MDKKKITKKIEEIKKLVKKNKPELILEIENIEKKLISSEKQSIDSTTEINAWEKVNLSRKIERPKPQDFIDFLIKDFIEFHGDRLYSDDKAIIGGIGFFKGIPVTAIGTRKGKDLKSNILYNFGMPHPEGYRKAYRLAKQAEKFKRPILFFVDTPGAYCGIDAEEHGISEAIAKNLYEFSSLSVPTITVITGEGGSGGALGLSVSNIIIMMENAIFSVISPEGCASILFKDSTKAELAAKSLRLTATDLLDLKIIDHIIPEGKGLHVDPHYGFKQLEKKLYEILINLLSFSPSELISQRYDKFRKISYLEKISMGLKDKIIGRRKSGKKKNLFYSFFSKFGKSNKQNKNN